MTIYKKTVEYFPTVDLVDLAEKSLAKNSKTPKPIPVLIGNLCIPG
jgi:hypothetical protein